MPDTSADDQSDYEIREAIAASLEGMNCPTRNQGDIVDLTGDTDDDEVVPIHPKSKSAIEVDIDDDATGGSDEYDEDLQRAIELSKQDLEHDEEDSLEAHNISASQPHDSKPGSSRKDITLPQEQNIPQPLGVLGLDRMKMEQERLARLAKRKSEHATLIDERETKQLKTETPLNLHVKQDVNSLTTTKNEPSNLGDAGPTGSNKELTALTPSSRPSVQFPSGVVKKTWVYSCSRLGDDIKIEEVLQKGDLDLAVLSSFMWDMEWLFSKLDTKNTRLLLMMQAKDESTKRQYESETASMNNLRLCFPPMDAQVNCMHSKLMLLFHKEYLRIVVPTANLTALDWGEMGGVMENSVFLIDLPKIVDRSSDNLKPIFYEDLVYFLKASTLHDNIISRIDNYDFSQTKHIAFVHTIGGSHTGDAWKRTGYCGLGRSVNALGLKQLSVPVNIDFITSSLGSLSNEFLRSLYLASQGDDGMTELTLRTAKSFSTKSRTDPKQLISKDTAEEWKERFRVYYPSNKTVKDSRGGPRYAGTICFQSKWYEGQKFPRHVLRDCESSRPGMLMHNKILYVRPDAPISFKDNTQCRAWAYVGSANLSESAWGRLVQDRTTKEPKLNCRNWECGVLILVLDKEKGHQTTATSVNQKNNTNPEPEKLSSSSNQTGKEAESANTLDIFRDTVPVPICLPGSRYGLDRKPWYNSV